MKKNLILIIITLFELLFVVLFTVPQFDSIRSILFFSNMWNGYKYIINSFANLINLNNALSSFPHRLTMIISLVILNVLFIVIYEIVSTIIVLIIRKNHKKALVANKLDAYELTEEEKAKFSWKLYQKHFPWVALCSFLVPIFLVLFFFILRFDKTICLNDNYRTGLTNYYSNTIAPFINSIYPSINDGCINFINNYISLINGVIDIVKFSWFEYIIIIIAIGLVFLIWFFFVWMFTKMFKKSNAKRRAKKAKKKYINKMEKIELKARKSAGERISSKSRDIDARFNNNQNNLYEDASIISIKSSQNPTSFSDSRNADYIDDISTGVIDLGVASLGEEEEKEPIEKKIPIFVGDEDVDIVLEKEPIIETIEEEDVNIDDEIAPFFEKYNPNDIDTSYLDDSLLVSQVRVYDEDEEIDNSPIKIEQYIEKNHEDKSIINSKDEIKSNESIKNVETETIKSIEYIKEDNVEIEENIIKQTIKPIRFEPKNSIKKPIKPLVLNQKYSKAERFKDARKKYFNYPPINIKREKEMIKKRNLIRRKHK